TDKGVPVGIWTCPQFVKAKKRDLPPEVDRPGYYEKFIDGHLLDLAGTDFTAFLLDHVSMLRHRYYADWWKYDQIFFAAETRHGVMKNVAAFQDAVWAVRRAHPDLFIENCQSGGRMINEFTALVTQNQWIRDGGDTGPEHARGILHQALGAIQFLPPWACNRWTNNPDRNDPEDDEFTRCYCRCAMAGTWGLVADLGKIGPRQRAIIIDEAAHYRRFSELKTDYVYDVFYPADGAACAGVAYYAADGRRAALLLCRWDAAGAFTGNIVLGGLRDGMAYRVEDADGAGASTIPGATTIPGDTARAEGLPVAFAEGQLSRLMFLEAVEKAAAP
ncbi:MAG: hypothetical protein JXR94_13145, partial [Candidatus Hydrogenedentes bacterium]|nr:hypothetical protein [Candidatus Hydrogenedentota bacterium]